MFLGQSNSQHYLSGSGQRGSQRFWCYRYRCCFCSGLWIFVPFLKGWRGQEQVLGSGRPSPVCSLLTYLAVPASLFPICSIGWWDAGLVGRLCDRWAKWSLQPHTLKALAVRVTKPHCLEGVALDLVDVCPWPAYTCSLTACLWPLHLWAS